MPLDAIYQSHLKWSRDRGCGGGKIHGGNKLIINVILVGWDGAQGGRHSANVAVYHFFVIISNSKCLVTFSCSILLYQCGKHLFIIEHEECL